MTKKIDPDKPKVSGRYRKVEVRTWGDAKFRALSPIPACAQGLWLFLITGPHTGPIPGLSRAGRAAMAEELGWEIEDFDKAFAEVFQQGMAEADFKARVLYVPNAIKHNKPESPNVVKSWAAEFDLIPECDLKWKAFEALKASIHALGEAYGEAFDKTFCKPSGKATVKTTGNQEQEQEQEQDSPSLRSGEAGADKPRRTRRVSEAITLTTYLERCKAEGKKPIPPEHFVRNDCRDAGITDDMLQVAWIVFRRRYTEDEKGKRKKYSDWPSHFANAINGRWGGLWIIDPATNQAQWSSTGLQQKAILDARARAKETTEAA